MDDLLEFTAAHHNFYFDEDHIHQIPAICKQTKHNNIIPVLEAAKPIVMKKNQQL